MAVLDSMSFYQHCRIWRTHASPGSRSWKRRTTASSAHPVNLCLVVCFQWKRAECRITDSLGLAFQLEMKEKYVIFFLTHFLSPPFSLLSLFLIRLTVNIAFSVRELGCSEQDNEVCFFSYLPCIKEHFLFYLLCCQLLSVIWIRSQNVFFPGTLNNVMTARLWRKFSSFFFYSNFFACFHF